MLSYRKQLGLIWSFGSGRKSSMTYTRSNHNSEVPVIKDVFYVNLAGFAMSTLTINSFPTRSDC